MMAQMTGWGAKLAAPQVRTSTGIAKEEVQPKQLLVLDVGIIR